MRADGSLPVVDVVIPARDEEATIGDVVRSIPRPLVRRVVVVDNGSADATVARAAEAGAVVVREPRAGYGSACLSAISAMPDDTEIVVFMVADGSDDPAYLARLIDPIARGEADLVIGSRTRGEVEPGAMTLPQRTGSLLAAVVLSLRFQQLTTDLGPFRAIRREALGSLDMRDRTYGWTVEMQIKAFRKGFRVVEVPVSWRNRRGGEPKVSGTLKGTLGAITRISKWLKGAVLGPTHDPV